MLAWSVLVCFVIITLSQHLQICGSIILECGESDKLCPGSHMLTFKCDTGDSNGIEWDIGNYEVDFHAFNNLNDTECANDFCGTFIQKSPSFVSTLQFESSEKMDGSFVYCKHSYINKMNKSCQISYIDPPSPPSNLNYTISKSHLLLTWTNSNKDHNDVSYSITSSFNNTSHFSTANNNFTIDINEYQSDVTYTVDVKAILCNGNLPGSTVSTTTFNIPSPNKTTNNSSIQPTPSTSTIQAQSSLVKNASIITLPVSSSSSLSHFTQTSVSSTSTPGLYNLSPTGDPPITDDEDFDHDYIIIAIVAGAIGGLLVLVVIMIMLVAFAFIIVAILRKMTPSLTPDTSHHDKVLPTVSVSQPPPPLPPRPNNTSIDIEVKTTSPHYENPLHLFSQPKDSSSCNAGYSIPFFGRILVPNVNSQTSSV